MNRAIVNVATGQYVKGQDRLFDCLDEQNRTALTCWMNEVPVGCPSHAERPYAFKAYAMKHAAEDGADTLLWCDACIVPGPRPLADLWEKIERDGYWIARNGWRNAQWCCDSWYADCFPGVSLEEARALNRDIPHVVATAFGISLKHPIGRAILDEYYRLASETKAFCGPWKNSPTTPCGPPEVLGHRHDQSCLSLIAHRLGVQLTDCPDVFSYRGGEDSRTILIADGGY